MSTTVNFVIRDGLERDLSACIALDHTYETDRVWQMQVSSDGGWRIDFKPERLPRTLEADATPADDHLRAFLPREHCFLVATTREEEPEIIGYLTMHVNQLYRIGLVQNVLVSRPYRRKGIAARMVKIATAWAKEHGLTSLMIETQTKNYPGIAFCEAAGFAFCGFNDRYFPNRDIAVFFSQSVR